MGNKWNKSEAGRAWRRKQERKYTLRYAYAMTLEQYDALLASQGGVCAICKTPPRDDKKNRLAVDHDHATGKNRGLLCTMCNHAVERIENDPEWGSKAIDYLTKFLEITVGELK